MKKLLLLLLLPVCLCAQTIRPTFISQLRLTQLTTAQEGTMTLVEGDIWYNTDLNCTRLRLSASSVCILEGGGTSDAVIKTPTAEQTIAAFGLNVPDLNNVRKCDQFAGADAGAKIIACYGALPSTGGIADATGLEGVQSAVTTIALPDDVTLLLGAMTLTSSANPGFTLGNSSALVCLGQGKTTIQCSSTTGTCIESVDNTTTKTFAEVRSCSVLASGTHTTSKGIDWTGMGIGRVEDVELANFGTQLFLDDNATSGTHYNVFDHLYIRAGNPSSGFDGLEIRRTSNANKFYSLRFSRLDRQIILGNAGESLAPNELLFVGTTMEAADTVSLEIFRANSVMFEHGRFEGNSIAIRAAADALIRNIVIDSPYFSGNTTDVSDSSPGLSIRPFGEGAKFEGRQSGLMNEAAPNLIANALMEGWNGTTDLLGWTSLTTTNWDTTGNETQESTIIQSGSFSVKAGDGTNASRGIATPDIIDIDPTKPYTLKFNWTTPNTTNGKMRYGFRLLDSSDVLITTGNVEGYALVATGTGTSVLTHSGSFNAHVIGSDQAPIAANTMQIQGHVLKFPTGVASVRFGIWASGGAAPDRFVYVDDIYFAEGVAALRGDDRKIGDSGDQTLYGNIGAGRFIADQGTSLVPGDFALSSGWGTTASVGTITGNDQWAQFTITSAGTGQAANPTNTWTFTDGTWTNAPIAVCQRADRANQAAIHFTWTTTATTLVLIFEGTPVAAETFVVACHMGGV